jgi:hypothetical protein
MFVPFSVACICAYILCRRVALDRKSRFVALSLRSFFRFYCFSCFTLPCKSWVENRAMSASRHSQIFESIIRCECIKALNVRFPTKVWVHWSTQGSIPNKGVSASRHSRFDSKRECEWLIALNVVRIKSSVNAWEKMWWDNFIGLVRTYGMNKGFQQRIFVN